jgi:alanyl aminopeptidase
MTKLSFALAVALLAGCGAAQSHSEGGDHGRGTAADRSIEETAPLGQLPADVIPTGYALRFVIDPASDGFSGTTTVNVNFTAPRRAFWMHAEGLIFDRVTLRGGATPEQCTAHMEPEHGLAQIQCETPLGGDRELEVDYHATWPHGLAGLYRVTEGGESYAFTQFEAISARKAFPCFDEPRFKTPFSLTITAPKDLAVLANTPESSRTESGALAEHVFGATPKLPTYLLAFAVGRFDIVDAGLLPATDVRTEPLPLRGVALHGKGEQLRRALDSTRPILEALESYTGIAYPFGKLDLVAVPDFDAGAMENPGLVTFREPLLLLTESSTEEDIRDSASVIAHELAHQWFGNYVTMPWWNELWLNEAFATWLGSRAHATAFPAHDADIDMLRYGQWAMKQDSLVAARRIREPIVTNHDIDNAFDAITYGKGANVLSMFERWLGADTFRDGVRRYLSENAWSSATTEEFLTAITAASANTQAGPAFRGFLDQPGVPMISFASSCVGDKLRIEMNATRYLPLGSTGDPSVSWEVPVCVRAAGLEEPVCTLVHGAGSIDVDAACDAWFLPNADAAGYFRSSMDARGLEALLARGWSALSVREKLGVGDSVRAGFSAGTILAEDAFRVAERFARERHPALVSVALDLMGTTTNGLVSETEMPRVRAWVERLLAPIVREVGWRARPRESSDVALLRSTVFYTMAFVARSSSVRREARRHVSRLIPTSATTQLGAAPVAPELVDMVLRVGVEEGGEPLFDRVERLFRASTDAHTRTRLLGALAYATEPALLDRALAMSLDEATRLNEMLEPLQVAMSRPAVRDRAWTWLREHEAALFVRISPSRASRLFRVGMSFCAEERAAEFSSLFGERAESVAGGPRNLTSTLELIRLCAAQQEAQRESAERFFRRTR